MRNIEKDLEDYREYNLLNSDDVRRMQEDEALIISKNRHPVKMKVTPYFQNRVFSKASQFPTPKNSKDKRNIKITLENLA